MKKTRLMTTIVFALSAMTMLAACGGGNNPGGGETSESIGTFYRITVDAPEGITVTGLPENGSAVEGQRITFKIVTSGNTVIDSVTYNDTALKPTSTGTYRFAMPATNVTIKIKTASVTGIEIDTSAVKKSFLVGTTFSSSGLKVSATLAGGTSEEVKTGVEVSTPNLSTVGTKTVTVTYGGFSKTYDIKVGNLQGDDADINKVEGKIIFSVLGSFEGFANAAELTEAANEAYLIDFQYNDNIGGKGWGRPYENNKMTFLDAGNGRFKVDVDVTDFVGAPDKGIGYTLHFCLPRTEGTDAGHASDLKLTQTTEHDGKSVVDGTKTYKLSLNVGIGNDGSKFWGCIGLTVFDTQAAFLTYSHAKLEVKDEKLLFVLTGTYRGYSEADIEKDIFYVDIEQFGSWISVSKPEDNPAVLNLGAPDETTKVGTVTQTIDLTGRLDATNDYMVHYGPVKADNFRSNLAWMSDDDAMEVVDPTGGVASLFKVSGYSGDADGWRNGLLGIHYLGGDYVIMDSVSLTKDDNKAVFHVGGIYSGISNKTSEEYFMDCMDLSSGIDVSNEGADTVLVVTPSSEGATSGKFDLSLDLTGKLTAGEPYYFHLGPVGGSGYRPNIYAPKDMELATVEVTGGKYVLSIGEGYTGEKEGWRNGLALVTFTPSN